MLIFFHGRPPHKVKFEKKKATWSAKLEPLNDCPLCGHPVNAENASAELVDAAWRFEGGKELTFYGLFDSGKLKTAAQTKG